MARTGFVFHPRCVEHETGPSHPERPERCRAVVDRIQQGGVWGDLDPLQPQLADPSWLARVHDADYVAHVAAVCLRAPAVLDDGDTPVSPQSNDVARLAAGGVLAAADRIAGGDWGRAFVATRPPGHHAERVQAMGFLSVQQRRCRCPLPARKNTPLNESPSWTLTFTTATEPNICSKTTRRCSSPASISSRIIPERAGPTERGHGAGHGATLNCPLPSGTQDDDWLRAFDEKVAPALDAFRPQFLLVSAGFDAHVEDPLSSTKLTETGYRGLTQRLLGLAKTHCQGRLLSVMEGGYNVDALARSVEAHVEELVAG